MIYWKGEHFWLGQLREYPDIMTQGETVEELKESLCDAFGQLVDMASSQLSPCDIRGFLKGIETDIEREPDRI